MPDASRIAAYAVASIPAAIGVWFVARFAYVTSDTAIDGASNAFLFGMLAAGAYSGPAVALAVAGNMRKAAACLLGILALFAMVANWSQTLGAIAHRGAGMEAERGKASAAIEDDRAELARLVDERRAMAFTRATADTVTAARDGVAAAERTRRAECGNGDPRQRGDNCRLRETEEQSSRTALTGVLANEALTQQAAKLEADAAAVRTRLAKAEPVKQGNTLGEALGRLLPMSAATAATFQQGLISAIVELLIAAALALPELLRQGNQAAKREDGSLPGHSESLAPMLRSGEYAPTIEGTALTESPRASAEGDVETAGRFMLACLVRAAGDETAGGAIYNRYLAWCDAQTPAVAALQPYAFAAQFAQRCERAGIRTRKQGNRVYCVGVRLVA